MSFNEPQGDRVEAALLGAGLLLDVRFCRGVVRHLHGPAGVSSYQRGNTYFIHFAKQFILLGLC